MSAPRFRLSKAFGWLGSYLLLLAGLRLAHAQPVLPPVRPDTLPQPRRLNEDESVDRFRVNGDLDARALGQAFAEPISLTVALRLAMTNNLEIAQARETVNRAQAVLLRSRVLALPNLSIGSTYVRHEGQIQRTEGNVITVNRDSLFVGGGPSMQFQITDALFAPLISQQAFIATEAGLQRVTNDTLLTVADAYFNVLRARRRLARVEETLVFLTSPQRSPSRGDSKGLLPLVRDIVDVGGKDAFRSDLERVRVEVLRRMEERAAAIQDHRVATAELARLLRLDPATPLWPIEDFRFPMALPGDDWSYKEIEDLIPVAMQNRPELAENRALVQAALERLKEAKFRPLLPSITMNYNYGDFGGGPDPNPIFLAPGTTPGSVRVVNPGGFSNSGEIKHFKNRTDFDIGVYWRLQNMGFGNRAEVQVQKAVHQQTVLRQLQVQDRVITQVVQAHELVVGWRERVDIARAALFGESGDPTGPVFRSVRLNFERIFGAEGRPLEVQDSIRGLNDMLEAWGQSITDYERARFRLLIALGLPPQDLIGLPPPHAPHAAPADVPPAQP